MKTAQHRRPSRSILANRVNQFAAIYDPDDEPQVQEQEPEPKRNPEFRVEHDGECVSLSLRLGEQQYKRYRSTRLAKNPKCYYCQCDLTEESITIDHILPQCRGGENWPGNCVQSCGPCNSQKSDQTPVEWLEWITRKIANLQFQAGRLQALIETEGLDFFVPICGRLSQSPPVKAAKNPKSTPTERGVDEPPRMSWGTKRYWIVDKVTLESVAKNLKKPEALRFMDDSPLRDSLDLMVVQSRCCDEPWWVRPADSEVYPEAVCSD